MPTSPRNPMYYSTWFTSLQRTFAAKYEDSAPHLRDRFDIIPLLRYHPGSFVLFNLSPIRAISLPPVRKWGPNIQLSFFAPLVRSLHLQSTRANRVTKYGSYFAPAYACAYDTRSQAGSNVCTMSDRTYLRERSCFVCFVCCMNTPEQSSIEFKEHSPPNAVHETHTRAYTHTHLFGTQDPIHMYMRKPSCHRSFFFPR